jgi:hypothetical protein
MAAKNRHAEQETHEAAASESGSWKIIWYKMRHDPDAGVTPMQPRCRPNELANSELEDSLCARKQTSGGPDARPLIRKIPAKMLVFKGESGNM